MVRGSPRSKLRNVRSSVHRTLVWTRNERLTRYVLSAKIRFAMPPPGRNRVIMDSMHGLTEFDAAFRRILDTQELQRLRWIRQTGLVFLVYPGAEHSRFSHALGAYG